MEEEEGAQSDVSQSDDGPGVAVPPLPEPDPVGAYGPYEIVPPTVNLSEQRKLEPGSDPCAVIPVYVLDPVTHSGTLIGQFHRQILRDHMFVKYSLRTIAKERGFVGRYEIKFSIWIQPLWSSSMTSQIFEPRIMPLTELVVESVYITRIGELESEDESSSDEDEDEVEDEAEDEVEDEHDEAEGVINERAPLDRWYEDDHTTPADTMSFDTKGIGAKVSIPGAGDARRDVGWIFTKKCTNQILNQQLLFCGQQANLGGVYSVEFRGNRIRRTRPVVDNRKVLRRFLKRIRLILFKGIRAGNNPSDFLLEEINDGTQADGEVDAENGDVDGAGAAGDQGAAGADQHGIGNVDDQHVGEEDAAGNDH